MVVNINGKKILQFFDHYGFVILNGRTKNDIEGHFTYMGGAGNSVIDLACVNLDLPSYVDNFKVDAQYYSDSYAYYHLLCDIEGAIR